MCRFLSPSTDRMRLIFKIVIGNITEIYKKILSWLTSREIDLLQVIGGGGNPQAIIKEKKNIWPL